MYKKNRNSAFLRHPFNDKAIIKPIRNASVFDVSSVEIVFAGKKRAKA